jgi:MoaA/NifB/PqqE/SkfB family radical SAM enzyme
MTLRNETRLHLPTLHTFEEDGISYAVDSDEPNWVAVDERGRTLLDAIACGGGELTFGGLVTRHAATHGLEAGKAWGHVHDFLQALNLAGLLRDGPVIPSPYPGRSALIAPEGLRELWIQVNNACNLTCTHCLVSSGPGEDPGLPMERLVALLDRACELGLERLYITGGEPFVRKDIFQLIRHATDLHDLDVIILTNATVLRGPIEAGIKTLDRSKVRFQVSIDGANAETNDRIRGPGTFEAALRGARLLADLGFEVSVTTVATRANLRELPLIPEIVRSVGAGSQHLMWAFRRGRACARSNGAFFPDIDCLLSSVMQTVQATEASGSVLDNLEAVKRRVNGVPGVKYDLGNGGWDSLCVYSDGKVFPSAALVTEPSLLCGDTAESDLEEILDTSPVVRRLREASLAQKPTVRDDPFRFFTGGGDWEHAWWASGDPIGEDPYYPIGVALVRHVMTTLGKEKLGRRNLRSGYDAPLVLHRMGEGAIACGTADGAAAEQPVLTLHSNCVLSFDVDKPRAKVREFYS